MVPVQDKELQRTMAQIFIDEDICYSQNAIKSAVDTMKLSLPVMGNTARHLIDSATGYLIPVQVIFGNTIKMTGC